MEFLFLWNYFSNLQSTVVYIGQTVITFTECFEVRQLINCVRQPCGNAYELMNIVLCQLDNCTNLAFYTTTRICYTLVYTIYELIVV